MKSCFSRLIAIVFGLFVAFLLIEIGIRLAYSALPQGLQIALQNVRITPFTDVRIVPPPIWQTDNDYQTITRPDLVNVTAAGSPEIKFPVTTYSWFGGRVGFRSPQPTDGRLDGAVLGDSFSFCFTAEADCWVNRLSDKTGLHFADLGQPVTGSISHARIFRTFALPVKPANVIWQFFGNDYNDDYGLAQLNGTAQTPPDPTATQAALPSGAVAVWLRENSVVYALVSALLRRNEGVDQFVDPNHIQSSGIDIWVGQSYVRKAFAMTNPRNLEGEALTHKAILETRDLVEGYGGTFTVVIMPTKEEVYSRITAPVLTQAVIDGISAPRLRLLEFCSANKLHCIDLTDALRAETSPGTFQQNYFARDMHLSPEGNRVVADAIARLVGFRKP